MTSNQRPATMVAVDGRDALAYVLLRRGAEPGAVSIEAGAKGVSKAAAAEALRAVADQWGALPEQAATRAVLDEIASERRRQDDKWGEQNHPDGTRASNQDWAEEARAACQHAADEDALTWAAVLYEEFTEALAEEDPAKLRTELLQVAAVAVAWAEAIDRRTSTTP
jgi:hypothetical protein